MPERYILMLCEMNDDGSVKNMTDAWRVANADEVRMVVRLYNEIGNLLDFAEALQEIELPHGT